MERPFQFSDDRDGARSPFNQQLLSPISQQPPNSFKTNVNRSKTRKWTEAKNYSYDGDDWGGYDPYDEYGSYEPEPQVQQQPQRNVSAPVEPRRNSFEAGDESTTFSSGVAASSPPTHMTPTKPTDDYGIRRDFSQLAHVPPPLQTRTSPSATRESHPARKSSLPSSPAQNTASPSSKAPVTDKPLPFIRPADIYKRLEEERNRASQESSVNSAPAQREQQQQGLAIDNPALAPAIGANVASPEPARGNQPLATGLPQVNRVASGFGSDFWTASELSPAGTPQEPADDAALQHQPSLGFRSVVNQAFDRQDDSSVPPTPISRDNSQSQHSSETSGISPIMSRVPSAATAEAKSRAAEGREAVPPIAEESSLPGSPGSQRTSTTQTIAGHSRNVSAEGAPSSFTQGYRRSLDTPSPNNSPAKSPMLEYTKRLSSPMIAENAAHKTPAIEPPSEHQSIASVRVTQPSADYSKRESDLAAEVTSSPLQDAAGAGQASQVARAQFLQTHNQTDSPASPGSRSTSPISRRESPGPGRVRDLAGKYNELHSISRSNSAMSINSAASSESMKFQRTGTYESNYSQDTEQVDSPVVDQTEQTASRPDPTRGPSFRPHLPGEWVSYASTRDAPPSAASPEAEKVTADDGANAADLEHETPRGLPRATEDLDLTPSTAKQPLVQRDITPQQSSPIDAVKAAGDALGAALLSTVGLNHETKDFAQSEAQSSPDELPERKESIKPSVGDVYLRPLSVDRSAPSIASSVGPTPPAKDTPKGLDMERFSGYFPQPVLRVDSEGLSPGSDYSPEGLESDRLRKEIERSLTPQIPSAIEDQQTRDQDALDAPDNLREVQKSEGLTTEDNTPKAVSPAVVEAVKDIPSATSTTSQRMSSGYSGLLDKRFSWEQNKDSGRLFGEVGDNSEPRAAYERPLSTAGLHVVNTNISIDSDDSSIKDRQLSHVEPIAEQQSEAPATFDTILSPSSPVTSPDLPIDTGASTTQQPADEPPLPSLPSEAEADAPPSAPSGSASRVPPFREILALKSANERIDTYNSTRDQFATMDTGLQNWLSSTLSSHPEHAHLMTDAPLKPGSGNALGTVKHRNHPSIMKMAKGLGSSSREPSGSHPPTISETSGGPERQNSQGRSPSQSHGGVEKMQTKGKDLLHSAGMLGGKATFGAKGLFAKAKGRLREGGSEKAPDRAPSPNALASPTSPDAPNDSTPRSLASPGVGDNKGHGRSQSRNRFSTAFGRFGAGTFARLQSRPDNVVVSPSEGPEVVVSQDRTPTPLNLPKEANVAPWSDEPSVSSEGKDERLMRIGLLPSPGLAGSIVSKDNASETNIKESAVENSKVPEAGQERDVSHDEPIGVAMTEFADQVTPSTERDLALAEGDEPTVEAHSYILPGSVLNAQGKSVEEEPYPVTPLESTHQLEASEQQPTSRISSVSSLDPENEGFPKVSDTLERTVSPVATELPSEPLVVAQKRGTSPQEERPEPSRPPLIGRSSLPSQQRQPEQRSSSWTWKGSRTSLALTDARPDTTNVQLPSRSGSAQHYYAPPDRSISPVSFLEEATSGEKPNGSGADVQPQAVPIATYNYPVQDGSQSVHAGMNPYDIKHPSPSHLVYTPTEMLSNQQQGQMDPSYFSTSPGAIPVQDVVYRQPNIREGEQIGQTDPERSLSPALMDPRQQGIEYQLPGVGPPEDVQAPRGVRGMFRSPLTSPAPAERIHPASVAFNHERTYSGDVIQTQEAQARKDKRRTSIFGAFSRTSSISGLSDGRQSRGNSRGNTTSTTPDMQTQASTASLVAAQKARENQSKGNTLKKVQRSSTSAGTPDPEKKQKRFSRLGSIFGRSNSEARKGNKLIKSMPNKQPQSIPEATRPQQKPPQNIPAPPVHYDGGMPEGSNMGSSSQWPSEGEPSSMPPPPGGWYAPISRRSSYASETQPTLPQLQPSDTSTSWQTSQQTSAQPTRRLHSEGFRHEPRYTEYRSMSPSPYQRMSSYDTMPALRNSRPVPATNSGSLPRNFSWGTSMPEQGYPPQDSPERKRYSGGYSLTPSHSRNASLGSIGSPPIVWTTRDDGVQRASSPALYGASPYQPPVPPVSESQQAALYHPGYAAAGPPQQASYQGMYYRQPQPSGYTRPGGSRHNSFSNAPGVGVAVSAGNGLGSRHGSFSGAGSRHGSFTGAAPPVLEEQPQQHQQQYPRQRFYAAAPAPVAGGYGAGDEWSGGY